MESLSQWFLPDRVMNNSKYNSKKDNLAYMRKTFLENNSSILLLEKVPAKDVSKYGIAKLEKPLKSHGTISKIIDIHEKPTIAKAPSRFAAVGRYIFENKILDFISNDSGSGKEIEITDAIKNFVGEGNISQATLLKGECFDCGSKQGYFYSILKTGLSLPEYKKEVLKSLKDH